MKKTTQAKSPTRPPIVTIMGHVDHGKTTLLDYLRSSNLAGKESGAITQTTAAYQVLVESDGIKRPLTLIDTPGHAAFTGMRARGGKIADIIILVVAADDGVKQQTIEAIQVALGATVPVIVALNKIDLEGIEVSKIKEQLVKNGLLLEGFGGKVPLVPISAKTGKGISDLLEMIFLTADLEHLKGDKESMLKAYVVEAHLDNRTGPSASVVVREGTLRVGDILYAGRLPNKIKAIKDDWGKPKDEVYPGEPAIIMGLKEVPETGTQLSSEPFEIAEEGTHSKDMNEGDLNILSVYVKADSKGTLEAVLANVVSIATELSKVEIVGSGVGEITENDVMIASSSKALIIGFQVQANSKTKETASQLGVNIHTYELIYLLLEDLEKFVKALDTKQSYLGKGLGIIIQTFPLGSGDVVAGVFVTHGQFKENDKIRILREGEEIYRDIIKQLRIGKERVKKVSANSECGILMRQTVAIKPEDVVEII